MIKPTNRPLILGGAIVLLLIALAILGPLIAPRDPLGRTLIAEIGGRTRGVPFPPFQSWEFPLGSDRFGRDLFSRLLWAVRPTLVLVAIVAGVRLVLGVIVGMAAGWGQGGLGRALNRLIDLALSVPVLVVALAAIAAVGIESGLPAFLIGMALTGWAETAQVVRAQTQLVAVQPYVQAARALGANGPQIVLRHVLRHIRPLLGVLLAFEISATLMLTAGLAFLGYFIGGGVWILVDGDAIPVAERVAGLPELGQLIGTADLRLSSRPPWEMIFPGLVVLAAILGFSLLGEGLRALALRPPAERRSWLGQALSDAEERLVTRAGRWGRRAMVGVYAGAALALGAVILISWLQIQSARAALTPQAGAGVSLAREAGWPSERSDPYGTLLAGGALPDAPTVRWRFSDPAGLSGGPAVAADGTLFVAGSGGQVYALGPDGAQRWSVALDVQPVGAPALGPDGTLYIADSGGGLSALSPADGARRWRFQSSYRNQATSGPIVGPDGTVYYTVIDAVQAVSPDGIGRWVGSDPSLPYLELVAPRLGPDGSLVFLKSSAFSTADGSLQALTVVPNEQVFADPSFLVGADGRAYYRSEHRVIPWRRVEAGVAVQPALTWGATNTIFFPSDAGATPGGVVWMLYTADYADTRLVWVGADGRLVAERLLPLRSGRAVAVAEDGTVQLCGAGRNTRLRCLALSPARDAPLWEVDLEASGALASGGAAVDGVLYVVTTDGVLYALK